MLLNQAGDTTDNELAIAFEERRSEPPEASNRNKRHHPSIRDAAFHCLAWRSVKQEQVDIDWMCYNDSAFTSTLRKFIRLSRSMAALAQDGTGNIASSRSARNLT